MKSSVTDREVVVELTIELDKSAIKPTINSERISINEKEDSDLEVIEVKEKVIESEVMLIKDE